MVEEEQIQTQDGEPATQTVPSGTLVKFPGKPIEKKHDALIQTANFKI